MVPCSSGFAASSVGVAVVRSAPRYVWSTKSAPARTRQKIRARPICRGEPVLSSANVAIASKPRNASAATETAPSVPTSVKPSSPVSGDSHGRAGPSCARTTTAPTQKAASTTISTARATSPTVAASLTPPRFSAVMSSTAAVVNTQTGTEGNRAWLAMPVNSAARLGMNR